MRLNSRHSNAGQALTLDAIRATAPSAFAAEAHSRMSARYTYIPTSAVIEGMAAEGFVPTFATQSKTRDSSRAEHTKHLIRFRRESDAAGELELGGLYPEICLVNSHDGSSAYQLFSGLFRLVCLNGLMTGERYEAVRIPHKGDVVRDVIDASYTVIADSRRAVEASKEMARIELSRDERMILAEAAHTLRFDGSELGAAIEPARLLTTNRAADNRSDLFTTLNVVQENTIRGGLRGWTTPTDANGERRQQRRVRTRAVEGIDQATALNRALFTLAERMAQLKAAA